MHTRTNRRLVAALLIAAGITGGVFVFTAHANAASVLETGNEISARLERMILTAGDIASAQQAYVSPGQPDQPWLERSATLLRQFADDVADVRALLRSADAARAIEDIDRGLESLVAIDGRAHRDLQQAQNLLAADLIFSEGRDTVSSLTTSIRDLKAAEQRASMSLHASADHRQWTIVGVVAIVWVAGLAVLVPLSTRGAAPAVPIETAASTAHELGTGAPAMAATDLAGAADVCASLARISDTATLQNVLERAAAVLDARGIVVWMGAGEELFPVLAWGYDDRVMGRLRPIPRNADNATADAWRSGRTRTVAADPVSYGAVAAPLTGVAGCVGVFAAEVRRGRESDPATQALAVIIAAQLASVVSAWPAGSIVAATDAADPSPIAASGHV